MQKQRISKFLMNVQNRPVSQPLLIQGVTQIGFDKIDLRFCSSLEAFEAGKRTISFISLITSEIISLGAYDTSLTVW